MGGREGGREGGRARLYLGDLPGPWGSNAKGLEVILEVRGLGPRASESRDVIYKCTLLCMTMGA